VLLISHGVLGLHTLLPLEWHRVTFKEPKDDTKHVGNQAWEDNIKMNPTNMGTTSDIVSFLSSIVLSFFHSLFVFLSSDARRNALTWNKLYVLLLWLPVQISSSMAGGRSCLEELSFIKKKVKLVW
jgi:hypothetical protein